MGLWGKVGKKKYPLRYCPASFPKESWLPSVKRAPLSRHCMCRVSGVCFLVKLFAAAGSLSMQGRPASLNYLPNWRLPYTHTNTELFINCARLTEWRHTLMYCVAFLLDYTLRDS